MENSKSNDLSPAMNTVSPVNEKKARKSHYTLIMILFLKIVNKLTFIDVDGSPKSHVAASDEVKNQQDSFTEAVNDAVNEPAKLDTEDGQVCLQKVVSAVRKK